MDKMMPSAPDAMHRHTGIAIVAHGLGVGIIAGLLTLGWIMTVLEVSPGHDVWPGWHRSPGTVFAMLIVMRLLWRSGHRPAQPFRPAPRLERFIAKPAGWSAAPASHDSRTTASDQPRLAQTRGVFPRRRLDGSRGDHTHC